MQHHQQVRFPCLTKNKNDTCSYIIDYNLTFKRQTIFVGYIDKDLFFTWFKDIFCKHCGDAKPVLLLMDNHDAHYSYELLQYAK